MSYTKGPATVTVAKFDRSGVTMEAFADERELVEHYVTDRIPYNGKFDDEEAIEWLESLKPRIDTLVACIRKPSIYDEVEEPTFLELHPLDVAMAPSIPDRWAPREAAAPIVVISGYTLKDDAGGVVPRIATEADLQTPGAIVWVDAARKER